MRKLIMSFAIAAFTIAGAQAQENKTVKKESTVKRVVTKEGSNVNVKETMSTDTEKGAVIVEGNNKINQEFNENTKKEAAAEVLRNDVAIDKNNKLLIVEEQERQKAEIEASRKRQLELAAKKREQFEEKQFLMQKELSERKARLQARPKGMSKLKKD